MPPSNYHPIDIVFLPPPLKLPKNINVPPNTLNKKKKINKKKKEVFVACAEFGGSPFLGSIVIFLFRDLLGELCSASGEDD
jgi:hypothetical protein